MPKTKSQAKPNKSKSSSILGAKTSDTQRHYADRQDEWQAFFKKTTEEFSQDIEKYDTFINAYAFLAEKRKKIAKKLEHGKETDITHAYGQYRTCANDSYETVGLNDKEGAWSIQAPHIHQAVRSLVSDSSNDSPYLYRKEINGKTVRHCLDIKSHYPEQTITSGIKCSSTLSRIALEESIKPKLTLHYTLVKQDTVSGNYLIADRYYQQLLAWKFSQGIDVFLQLAGRLSHYLAHLMLTKRGNASIVELMVLGLARHHKIDLGEFNANNNLAWDWKALITPSPEDYCLWYSQHAFTHSLDLLTKPLLFQFDIQAPSKKETPEYLESYQVTCKSRHPRGFLFCC